MIEQRTIAKRVDGAGQQERTQNRREGKPRGTRMYREWTVLVPSVTAGVLQTEFEELKTAGALPPTVTSMSDWFLSLLLLGRHAAQEMIARRQASRALVVTPDQARAARGEKGMVRLA